MPTPPCAALNRAARSWHRSIFVVACSYFFLLRPAPTVYTPGFHPKTWIVPKSWRYRLAAVNRQPTQSEIHIVEAAGNSPTGSECDAESQKAPKVKLGLTGLDRLRAIVPLLRYIIPLTMVGDRGDEANEGATSIGLKVYALDYSVQQGIVNLIVFNCASGFSLSRPSQFRSKAR